MRTAGGDVSVPAIPMEYGVADIITVMNLGWAYAPASEGDDARVALRDVSCYVPRGGVIGVVGPSGSGKSTFAKALVGLIPHCTAGTLTGYARIADMNVKSTSVSNLSLRVGYVGQNPWGQIVAETVEEEIAFPLENRGVAPDEIRARVDEVLAMLHIEALRHRLTATLSAGELERVAIGSAIAAGPDVLILDEPSNTLDEQGRDDLFAIVEHMREDARMTTLVVEQRTRALAHHATGVFLMVGGEIIRRTGADIFEREGALLESVGVDVPRGEAPTLTLADDEPAAAGEPGLVLDHVGLRYPDSTPDESPALEGVSLRVERGSFVGVVGANGSGKSTLLRLLDAQLRPQRGHVAVAGVDVATRRTQQMARLVAYVGQDPAAILLGGTVREEIAQGARSGGIREAEANARVNEMIRLFDLYGVEDTPVAQLADGQRRATALAAALAARTPVIALDEPLAGFDVRLRTRVLDALAEACAHGATVVMASGDVAAVGEYCTYAARLDAGRLVGYGRVVRDARGAGRGADASQGGAR